MSPGASCVHSFTSTVEYLFWKQKDIEFVSISLVSLSAVLVVFLGIMLVVCDDYDNDVYL